jgi:hypothetical protein
MYDQTMMYRSMIAVLFSALVFALIAGDAAAGVPRSALVIGNSAYTEIPALVNPVNDARDIAAKLRSLNFDVVHGENLDQRGMEKVIREFGRRVRAVKGDALFYYAGHGVEREGRNYLIPLEAGIEGPEDLRYKAVDVGQLLGQLESAKNGVNIIVLDACRNNPYENFRGIGVQGLASMTGPTGSLIAFATSPGSVAADGVGRNGVFTKHLLHAMGKPGAGLDETFREVRRSVANETRRGQIPWSNSSVIGDFYFTPPGAEDSSGVLPSPGESGAPTPDSASDARFTMLSERELLDQNTGLIWLCSTGRSVYSHKEAGAYGLSRSSMGQSWRLPTGTEFRNLIDGGGADFLPGFSADGYSSYWLSAKNFWLGEGKVVRIVDDEIRIEKRALSGNSKVCFVRFR